MSHFPSVLSDLMQRLWKDFTLWLGGGALADKLGRLLLHEMGPETGPEGRARLISICSNKCGRAAAHLLSVWKIKWDLQSSGLLRLMCSNYQPGPVRYRLSCQEIDETDRRLPVPILSSVLSTLLWKTDDINKRQECVRPVRKFGSELNSLSVCRHKTRADTVNTAGWHTVACSAWVQPQMYCLESWFFMKNGICGRPKKIVCRKSWCTINLSHRFSSMVRS